MILRFINPFLLTSTAYNSGSSYYLFINPGVVQNAPLYSIIEAHLRVNLTATKSSLCHFIIQTMILKELISIDPSMNYSEKILFIFCCQKSFANQATF